jgi:hypothetical protein
MDGICSFLGVRMDDRLVAHVAQRADRAVRRLALPEDLRRRCDDLMHRLDAVSVVAQHGSAAGHGEVAAGAG